MDVSFLSREGRMVLSRRALIGGGLAITLAGCNSSSLLAPEAAPPGAAPAGAPAPAVGETLGTGPVRVGMILPLTQNGAPSPIGASMRNAAQLAIDEFSGPFITLMIQDDRSSPEGAAEAAKAEIGAGAQLLLGPLYANNVRQAASVARGAGKPMIAFSTDIGVAGPGVFLLSFLVETYDDRIAEFAVSRGKKAFAAMAPQTDYANAALAEFQQVAGRLNAPVAVVARYPAGQPQEAAQQIAAAGGQFDALFIPEQADGMPAVASALAASGVKTQLLGTGVWNDARVLRLPQMQGAWFAAPDSAGFDAFAQKYKAKFGSQPTRLATLSYDAVSLAGALARGAGPDPFSLQALTNVNGFNGADGVFRFRSDGWNERGLAVMEIDNNAAVVVSPAPRSFAGG
ncbi:amino acid/amide ABC transporter substrate-binding protein (HAAT family) [Roseiarcus fermentans]|uniref:Amino acid/amide ABC transporter substrate-binding protein (HAAT family) n=1 Tax=Roseiarcus fermentans TaxID=1473586 RepID=A0A366FTT2_9HYPH|nr:penicillin-binding protein activator [Roseiarcus fermentans]RBP18093.1 amino acid/amide ABC transporter substrate-binding protein (HAAT family) [Roseiarcus fermentans]